MSNHEGEWEGKRGLTVTVRDNNVDQALRKLKKLVNQEGLLKELKDREHYTRPGEKRRLARMEARRRAQKANQKQNSEWAI